MQRLSSRLLRLLPVLLASLVCAAPAFAGQFGSFAAATDLDGDRRVDLATATASQRDAAGYTFEVSVRLNSVDLRAVTVRTATAASRMFARDVDGDADRDIIVESFDRQPIAVLLNDGGGHFHQVPLDQFRARLQRSEAPFLDVPEVDGDSPDTGECPPSAADVNAAETGSPELLRSGAVAPPAACPIVLRHIASATRGPPSSL